MRPRAFRIRDFRSIIDSGVCILSGDNITVLAGQNEAGKTAVLNALRDFDVPEGDEPVTPEFMPEGRYDANPMVSVEFEVNVNEIVSVMSEEKKMVPPELIEALRAKPRLWITRDLLRNKYTLGEEFRKYWSNENSPAPSSDGDPPVSEEAEGEPTDTDKQLQYLGPEQFAGWLRDLWPVFVFFDSFQDTLPREVFMEALISQQSSTETKRIQPSKSLPTPVLDFITLSEMELSRVSQLSNQEKSLGNYLQSCAAAITGDFLEYWKQKTDGEESVVLQVRHGRDQEGKSKLYFYVHDRVDQYPEQRSKGFLWFLSFYLRLAAEQKRDPNRKRLLLIDEPGSYLHARAQRDVLHLFEDRIAANQQIVYSTHSPFLLPSDRLHRLRVVLKSAEQGTLILDRLTHPALRGNAFADTLSPIITAIGLDIREAISFAKPQNMLVEGISDHMYITNWLREFNAELSDVLNVFPGTGATTIPLLASLFVGWGLNFVVLVDRDDEGNKTKEKLRSELNVAERRIVQPNAAITIEDLFFADDFRALILLVDANLTLGPNERPSAAIKRQRIDKVLLARTFSENAESLFKSMTEETKVGIQRLLGNIKTAVDAG